MYFWISGNHKKIAAFELQSLGATNINLSWQTFFFDYPHDIKQLQVGSLIKIWRIITIEEIDKMSKKSILWTDQKRLAQTLKKEWYYKRYKIIEPRKSDKELKQKWDEILALGKDQLWLVMHYQNIPLYETIDFDKPSRGMKIGMMPTKLTHTLLNIAVGEYRKKSTQEPTIYDPFVWFGTTSFLANALGYDTFGSDKNITQAKLNKKWRDEHQSKSDKKILFIKHDVTNPFNKKMLKNSNCIVTEWWLWPIINHRTTARESYNIQKDIYALYEDFLRHSINFFAKGSIIVITAPVHLQHDDIVPRFIEHYLDEKGIAYETCPEVYSRKWQKVGRQIIKIML